MDAKRAEAIVREYAQEVAAQFNPEQIVLYGSYANGTATVSSDIDVAVIYNGFEGSLLETSAKLWSLARRYSTDIEPILLDKKSDRSGFVSTVLETGHVVYTL